LNEGKASAEQRLVYAPKGRPKGAVSSTPFKGSKALGYYQKGVSVVEGDF
jgi:hypothetical protein